VLGIYNNNNIYIVVIQYDIRTVTQNTTGSVWELYTALYTLKEKIWVN